MSESAGSDNPTFGSDLPLMALDHDDLSTLPSSKSYEAWAASCPEVYHDFGGKIGATRAKLCPFCGKPTRLGQGSNQSLIEHMKSRACIAIQWGLECEILDIPESKEVGTNLRPSTPSTR
jgi:hypothetical protein